MRTAGRENRAKNRFRLRTKLGGTCFKESADLSAQPQAGQISLCCPRARLSPQESQYCRERRNGAPCGDLWANERCYKSFYVNNLREHPKGRIRPFRLETKAVKSAAVALVWRSRRSAGLNRMSHDTAATRGRCYGHGGNRRYLDDRFRLCRRPLNDSVCISGIALLHSPYRQVIIAFGDSIVCRRLQFGISSQVFAFGLPCTTRLAGLEV